MQISRISSQVPQVAGVGRDRDQAGSLPAAVPSLPVGERARLMQLASVNQSQRWNPAAGWAAARNAHVTNTVDELTAALNGAFNYLEGDVRSIDRIPVMRHGSADRVDMQLADWLAIGRVSGRGLKLDIKEQAAILPSVLLAREAGIDGGHLIINVSMSTDPIILMNVRQIYPGATVNLSPSDSLAPAVREQLKRAAAITRGPVMFPLRVDLVTQEVINDLAGHGAIAIWNDPGIPGVVDVAALTRKLRDMGVDGMIDLRPSKRGA